MSIDEQVRFIDNVCYVVTTANVAENCAQQKLVCRPSGKCLKRHFWMCNYYVSRITHSLPCPPFTLGFILKVAEQALSNELLTRARPSDCCGPVQQAQKVESERFDFVTHWLCHCKIHLNSS